MSLSTLQCDAESTACFNRIQAQRSADCHRPAAQMPGLQNGLLRVLVVDDMRDTTDLLARVVELWGHQVHKAYGGAAALAAAARQTPDVVLLDIVMPDMNGFELA
jgi:PleD family two-component response regulator